MNQKSKKLLSDTLLFFIGSIGSKFIQFFLVPLYTYTMTTSEYGTSDLVLTTVNFLMPVFSLQLSDALLRFGLDKRINHDNTINIVFKILFIGTFLSVLLAPLLNFSDALKNFILYFVLILNLRIYRDNLAIILKIKDKNLFFAIDSIIYTFVLCLSSFVTLAILKLGINGYFVSYILANVCSIIFILLCLKISPRLFSRKIDKKLAKDIVLYSLPMIINSISYWITTVSDRYMINIFMDVSSVGLYAVASKIPTIISTFTGIFNQAWLISSIKEYENDRDANFYSATFKTYSSISFIACSILILLIKPFMKIYVSPEYFITWQYSSILILSAVFSGISAFLNSIFYAFKKNIKATMTTLIGALINIILNLLLIPKFGILGASIATLLSWLIVMVVRIIAIRYIVPIKIKYLKFMCSTILVFVQIINLYYLNGILLYLINTLLALLVFWVERGTVKSIMTIIINKFFSPRNKEKNPV